jgi:hypothetical protein
VSDSAFAAAVTARPIPARDHCLAPNRVDAPIQGGRYVRLFADLPPLESDESLLHALGRAGGICDGADGAADDARVAAGWPFFGQYVAHDITADRSPLTHHADPERVLNFRTPRANLEAVYGGGPTGSPYLYDRDDPAKLLVDGGDVPRNAQGIALLGDPRNDVHLFMSQMQVAFLGLHNRLVDRLRADGVADVFEEARRAAVWHYQWVLLHEFLPSLIGAELTTELLEEGPSHFLTRDRGVIPLEFADAAYRYGHSQIRHAYQVNESFGPVALFPDLMGFGPVPADKAVDWRLLFDVDPETTWGPASGGHSATASPSVPASGTPRPAQRAKRLDGRLPRSLIALPHQLSGEEDGSDYASLAVRDLQRGQAMGLASGEAIARHMGIEPLSEDEVGLREHGWTGETPLWLYILREADVRGDGDRLGPLGGRIVGEVLVGIVDADVESFRTVDPSWRPTLPARRAGRFELADVLVPVSG